MFRAGYARLSTLGDCFPLEMWLSLVTSQVERKVTTSIYSQHEQRHCLWTCVHTCMSFTYWMRTYSFQLRLRVLIQHITVMFTAGKLDSAIGGICWSKGSAEPHLLQLKRKCQNEDIMMKICMRMKMVCFKVCITACSNTGWRKSRTFVGHTYLFGIPAGRSLHNHNNSAPPVDHRL